MSDHLLSAFAKDDPERFARLLGASGNVTETTGILTDIPDGLEGDVVSRLTVATADQLLNQVPDAVVISWLSSCSSSVARSLLGRIGSERSANLISGIEDRSKRRELQHLVKYPTGTIGELLLLDIIAIRDSLPVSDIYAEMQQQSAGPDAPVVLIRNNGTVSGILDLVKLLKNQDRDAIAKDFQIAVKPVFADASRSSLWKHEEWNRLTSFPVVDYEGHLIGYVPRTRIENSLDSDSECDTFVHSIIELSREFFRFMAHMLLLIFDRRNPG